MAIFDIDGNPITVGADLFADVTSYGAKGDGTTDDSTAIQSALDALKTTGGIIFFPKGTYKVSSAVYFYSNQTLLFENGAVIKAGVSGQTHMMASHVDTSMTAYNGTHDVVIKGATFDGSSFNSNTLPLGMAHAKNILIDSCSFINVYGLSHNIEINSSCYVRIKNCYFTRGGNPGANGEMIQLDRASTGVYVDDINTDGTQCSFIDIYENTFGPNSASPAVGNHSGTPNVVNVHDNFFESFTGTRGAIDLASTNLSIYNNVFNGCTIGVNSEGATHYIHDNRFIGATTAINGTTSVTHNNMVNGTFVA